MTSPPVLDLARLLAPIAGENPAGENLRADSSPTSLYYRIKDARSTARAAERQVVMEDEEPTTRPDWRPVLEQSQKALAEKAKDLEIASYLIEAVARLHGFAGLRDGFQLVRELVVQFWDGLYPLPDEEGLETRLSPLTSLNGDDGEGTLITPILKIPLTEGSSAGPFALYHYQQAVALAKVADEAAREKRVARGAVTLAKIEQAVRESTGPFYGTLVADLQECQEEFARLGALLEEKAGGKAPPTSNIRGALDSCLEAIMSLAREKIPSATSSAEEAAGAEQTDGTADGAAVPAAAGSPAHVAGVLRTRDDALKTLLQVAEFFRRTEPHTPVSYALEQAVRWGKMSLPELLTELIPDDSSRQSLFKQVGIPAPAPPAE